ncbi:hypothetical protein GQX74_003082 [Glossina fuscipes]|nr:hypothetical protein GQX74_003082 [Glossina fuscipes]
MNANVRGIVLCLHNKPPAFDNLVIEGYFQEVLASNLLKSDDAEIQLHKDGSWSTHSLRADSQILDIPTKPVEKVEVISDDIELITTEDVKPIKAAAVSVTVTSNDDSDDDDTPLAKRRPACKINTSSATSSTVSTSNINGNSAIAGQHRGVDVQQKTDADLTIICLDSPSPPSTPVRSPKIDVSSMNDFKVYQNKDANKFLENPPSCER